MNLPDRLQHSLRAAGGFAVGDLLWYAAFAGAIWLLFYVLLKSLFRRRKIVPQPPAWPQIGREVGNSVRSVAIFGLTGGLVVFLALSGFRPRVYRSIDEYGWGWYAASIVIAVFVHDAYFYWTHRLLHHPRLFRRFHRTHHLSHNPTPWAAYSFSAGEAVVQAGIGPLLVYTLPMHYSAFVAFMTLQITFNVFGHCGYEILPRWFLRSPLGMFMNTVTHHAMHHEKVHANYGLYFNIWDRLMGTNHAEYEQRFAAVTSPGPANDAAIERVIAT